MMVDIWRDRHPEVKTFTFIKNKPHRSCSRLDYFLVEAGLANHVTEAEIKPGYCSDHSRVMIRIETNKSKQGRGLWKINNRILSELDYVQEVNSILDKCFTYNCDNPQDMWEMIKSECIQFSQNYSRKCASARKLIISQ